MQYPSDHNHFLDQHVRLLDNSYRQLLGHELITGNNSVLPAQALFYAPFAVVSHNTEADPIFNYANLKALDLFGFSWDEFTALPSRLSAEPMHRFERERLLDEVSQKGYIDNYSGVRITKTGARFLLKNAVVWNLTDQEGRYAGQAACFAEWEFL